MNPIVKMSLLASCCLLVPLPALAGEIIPNVKIGDTFTYVNSKGKVSTEKLVRITPEGLYEFQTGNKTFLMTATMSTVTTLSGKKVDPHNGQLMLDANKAPGAAQIGTKWRQKYNVTSSRGTIKKDRACKVTAFEKKKVKAGDYLAYKVTCTIKTKGKKGNRYSTTWYDADTLRSLWVALGNSSKSQKMSRQLLKVVR